MTILKCPFFAGFLIALSLTGSAFAVSTVKSQPPKVVFKSGSTMQFNGSIMPKLLRVSDRLKRQIMVTSGWRSAAQNRSVGGAKRSAHLTGNAVDIRQQSNPRALASQIYRLGVFPQVLWNSCRPHVHIATDRAGHSDECGGQYARRKQSKIKGKKKQPKKPKKRSNR